MKSQPKVSIIIPIYGVEQYIERCARSLFEQTLDDLEYIFINDCTPDKSVEILLRALEEYPSRKEQVRIIHQPYNMGAAKARENGIKLATGQYIIHCDSDDWVDKDMYRIMYQKATDEGLDMLICDWFETDGESHLAIQQNLDVKSDLILGLVNRSISGSLWNKLTASCIYKKMSNYPTEHMMEDVAYSIQLVANSKDKIGYLAKPFYYYYYNSQSICHKPDEKSCKERCRQACANIDNVITYLKQQRLENKYSNELVVLKNSARVFLWPLLMENPKKYLSVWKSVYPEINKKYPFTTGVRWNLKLIFFLTEIGIYPYFHRLIKKIYINI